jgi:tRNA1Val (adenine37-N6)-methyltransferase
MPHPEVSFVAPVSRGDGADGLTVDTLLRGRVTLLQPTRGFRSSLDPVLLAAFVRPPFGRFVDIGCGTGALAFSLAALDEHSSGVGVEIQPRLAALAQAGLGRNTFADRLQVVHADIRFAAGQGSLGRAAFDLVATNPPYRMVSAGVRSPHPERAQANHEVSLTLDECLDAAISLVNPTGRVAVVYPTDRLRELLSGFSRRRLTPSRLRLVQPRLDRPASRVLVEAQAGVDTANDRISDRTQPPGGLVQEPTLVLHEPTGGFTAEARNMLGEALRSPDDHSPRHASRAVDGNDVVGGSRCHES